MKRVMNCRTVVNKPDMISNTFRTFDVSDLFYCNSGEPNGIESFNLKVDIMIL